MLLELVGVNLPSTCLDMTPPAFTIGTEYSTALHNEAWPDPEVSESIWSITDHARASGAPALAARTEPTGVFRYAKPIDTMVKVVIRPRVADAESDATL